MSEREPRMLSDEMKRKREEFFGAIYGEPEADSSPTVRKPDPEWIRTNEEIKDAARTRIAEQAMSGEPEARIYISRCGYCGEIEGKGDPNDKGGQHQEVCSASTTDDMHPHRFGVFEALAPADPVEDMGDLNTGGHEPPETEVEGEPVAIHQWRDWHEIPWVDTTPETYGKLATANVERRIVYTHPADSEKPRNWKHDCEDWAMEGVACARCNPMAVTFAEPKGAREAENIIRDFMKEPCVRGEICRNSICNQRMLPKEEWCWGCLMASSPFGERLSAALASQAPAQEKNDG